MVYNKQIRLIGIVHDYDQRHILIERDGHPKLVCALTISDNDKYECGDGSIVLFELNSREAKPCANFALNPQLSQVLRLLDYRDKIIAAEPSDIAVITLDKQAQKREKVYLTAFGEIKTCTEWVNDSRCIMSRSGLINRIRAHPDWTHERLMTEPFVKSGPRKKFTFTH
jgi:hypothetical protein